mgnify:FL=1
MLNLNFIKSYIGALRDYTLLKEEVKKSFALPFSQIKNKDYPNIFVTQPSKQIKFDKEFVSRMRNITKKEIVVSAHWEDMYQIGDKKNFHKNLLEMNDDEFFNQIANPSKNNLHYGFGDICKYVLDNPRISYFYLNKTVYDTIFRICCSLGLRNFPETYHSLKFNFDSPDKMLQDIFEKLGHKTDFPNVFEGEFGLKTNFGVVSFAPIQQMYHAIKILEFSNTYNIKNPRILEIGAGLGLSAYHARNFNIKDYTILDLSLGNLSQSFFFGSTIGKENIIIGDEVKKFDYNQNEFKEKIKLIQSTDLELIPDNIDLIINCDSITEMSQEQAEIYTKMASKKAKYFLSLNHDNNKFRISDTFKNTPFKNIYRVPTWYRHGYIEELYVNTSI